MTEGELKLKAEQRAPGYMNTIERAIYISAYIDGFEDCQEENKNKFDRAKEIIKIMKRLLFNVCGYIAIPFEKKVNDFLKEVKMKIPKEKIITKFCLFVHTHNFALHGYFTGFYRVLSG